jgi:hypothetical protein
MPVKTAFDMDDVHLFDYCQRNELLGNLEISSIFGKYSSQADSTRERKRETSVTDDPKAIPRDMHACMQECHAAEADTCTAENLIATKGRVQKGNL